MPVQTQNSEPRQLGITSAISLSMPTQADLMQTKLLRTTLEQHNVFETPAELSHRMEVLAQLDVLVKKWIKDTAIAKHMPATLAERLGGKIYTFGSFRLGVHDKGADIDALCVAPRNIEPTDFFRGFYRILKAQPQVTECRSIEEAFVPVIKMNFGGIEIDLLFARLSLKEIPDSFELNNDYLLRNLDQRSVRSLNGCRVTDAILELVPDKETFCLALRAIKLWAKKRGVYSNSMGYFGGVTWAMLMARVCQLYPNAAPSTLVQKLFLVFANWQWPSPVLLKQADNINLGFTVWDPRINLNDRFHLMPIITPAYPQQNSTYNVTESTKKIIVDEIKAAHTLSVQIAQGKATWENFFETPSFYYKYKHFIVLLASALTMEDQLEWCGLVEAKVRLLVSSLEKDPHITLAHVNPKKVQYNRPTTGDDSVNITAPFCTMWFIGLTFNTTSGLNLDLTETIHGFTGNLTNQAASIRLLKNGMSVEARYVKRKQLSLYLDEKVLQSDRIANKSANKNKRRCSESGSDGDSSTEGRNNVSKRMRIDNGSVEEKRSSLSSASSRSNSPH